MIELEHMKTYFTRLFDYDRQTNHVMIKTISETGLSEKAVQLMAHVLAAQQIWLGRCKQEVVRVELWPDWKIESLEDVNLQNHQQWLGFINSLDEAAFDRTIAYQNSKGHNYKNILNDILTHIINHGTHHRAQAGQQLKFAGVEKLPITDYIFFTR